MKKTMDQKIYEQFVFGKLALKQLGTVKPNFRLYEARMLPLHATDWTEMVVTGAEFAETQPGPSKRKHFELIPGTERTVRVSRSDIEANNESELDVA
ncbi:hypothetical protein P245_20350 [Comamonas thiooxydans]|uniref:Uncharacterized protein n=2 Tax=Comamonas thiooxydans TaxID=363952 RepID=A0A0E3BCE1_9BURK|nr:hypothetical protein P245_20350 [Comamonas thiooxydans]